MSSSWEIRFTRQAKKDVGSLTLKLQDKLFRILTRTIANDPYIGKRLIGDLRGSFSIRLTYKDRIIYSLDETKRIIYVERARTHYGN